MNKSLFVLMLFIAIVHHLSGQTDMVQHHTGLELNLNAIQLNSSIVANIFGTQLIASGFLNQRIEIINSASLLFRKPDTYYQNDIRMRLWGGAAGKWHPGFAAELGYLIQTEDWLREDINDGNLTQHGILFGGTWYFPLKTLDKGFVVAKWAYVVKSRNPNMTIFNCYVHWNLLKNIAIHIGGDIYTEIHNLKYSGFTVGLAYQIHKQKNT